MTSEDTVIEAKSEVTDLGVLMSSSGSFKLHVKDINNQESWGKVELDFQGVFNTRSKTNAYSIPSFNSFDIGVSTVRSLGNPFNLVLVEVWRRCNVPLLTLSTYITALTGVQNTFMKQVQLIG